MASSQQGRWLTEQHRLEQQKIRSAFLAEFIALWALLDTARLDDTSPGWIQAVLRLVRDYRIRSAQASVGYFAGYRSAEVPGRDLVVEVPRLLVPPNVQASPIRMERPTSTATATAKADPTPPRTASDRAPSSSSRRAQPERAPGVERREERRTARVEFPAVADTGRRERRRTRIVMPDLDFAREDRATVVSLEVTGPIAQKDKIRRGKLVEVARDESFVHAAGAASRHVLTGGRKSLLTLLTEDPQALGWARVTDGDPCAFCAMLSSRGIVYTSEASAGFKAHDNCACTAEPAYSRSAPLPGRGDEFQRLWNENIRGQYSGHDAINAFRRLYEQRQRDQRRSDVA